MCYQEDDDYFDVVCDLATAAKWDNLIRCGCSMRCLLVDEEREIRTAALRVLRYLVRTRDQLRLLLSLQIDILIAR